jgi:hypothetical protein
MTITIWELAIHRGAKADSNGGMSGMEIERVGLPFIGGCVRCGACIAAYNAAPTTTGFLACAHECAEDIGYDTVEQANQALFPEESTSASALRAQDQNHEDCYVVEEAYQIIFTKETQ